MFKKGRVCSWKRQEQKVEAEVEGKLEELRCFLFLSFHSPRGGVGIKREIRTGEQTTYLFRPEMPGERSDWILTAVTISTGQRDFSHDARETCYPLPGPKQQNSRVGTLSLDQSSASHLRLWG